MQFVAACGSRCVRRDPPGDPLTAVGRTLTRLDMSTRFPGDSLLSLAFAMRSTKGGYALLLGSGVSSGAGIPTGWGVTLDLIKRLADLKKANARPDPAKWYEDNFGSAPDYSSIVESLASTPTERRELLRGYFEPSEEERAAGLKVPSSAHRAIASLAANGYFRIIVTTNFDRLLEVALTEAGVTPAVISNSDGILGALPLHLEKVTVVKVNGDYLDTRIRNTPSELAHYDPSWDKLLDRIFDEYGLIVCGWSAAFDEALCSAIVRCPSRRFTTFWTEKDPLTPQTRQLVQARQAHVITIDSADAFFDSLNEKIVALESIAQPHPASIAVAVATAKRYLPVAEQRIRLRDLIVDETEAVRARALADNPGPEDPYCDPQKLTQVIAQHEQSCAALMAMLAVGTYWGTPDHREIWTDAIERLANAWMARIQGGLEIWSRVVNYPAQLAFYAAGLGAVGRGNLDTLADLLLVPRIRSLNDDKPDPPAVALHLQAVVDEPWAKEISGVGKREPLLSDHLHAIMRAPLMEVIKEDRLYDDMFDRFEYFVALAYVGLRYDELGGMAKVPAGRLKWRREWSGRGVFRNISNEIDRADAQWFLLKRGLFGGDPMRLRLIKKDMDQAFRSR